MVWKPSEKEEEYFARMEFEKRKKAEEEKQAKLAGSEKKKLKELHHMKCPKRGMDLIEIDYKNIKIDKCSGCDGVWLDAGAQSRCQADIVCLESLERGQPRRPGHRKPAHGES